MRRITADEEQQLALIRENRWSVLTSLAVETKAGRAKRMDDPTPAQVRWGRKLHRMARRPGEPGWQELFGVKPRQVRYSQTMLGSDFVDVLGDPDPLTTLTITDANKTTQALFKKLVTMIRGLPPEWQRLHDFKLNHTDHTCVSSLTGARLDFLTAGGKSQARGWTYQRGRMEELAYWPSGQGVDVFGSATAAMSDDSPIAYVSTSNGHDPLFYAKAQVARTEARKGSELVGFEFSPWYEEPTYRKEPPPGWEPLPDDARVMGLYGLDIEQAYWRHWKLWGVRGIDASLFRKHYPATFEEAFHLKSGGWYDSDALDEIKAGLPAAIDREIRIYRKPDPNMVYAAGIDPSWCTGGDDAVLKIRDVTGRDCAAISTNKPGASGEPTRGLERFAQMSADLLHRYHNPVVLPETNITGGGHVVLKILKQEGCRIYMVPPKTRKEQPKLWVTDNANKSEAFEHHRLVTNSDVIEHRDHITVEQMYYIREIDGKIEGVGNKDDHVMADVLCEWVRKGLPGAKHDPKFTAQRRRPVNRVDLTAVVR